MTDVDLQNRVTALQTQLDQVTGERDSLKSALSTEKIGRRFSESKFIVERLRMPADIVEANFRRNFKFDGDAIVARDENGNKLYSRARPGELADFDEALSLLVEQSPHKAVLLRDAEDTSRSSGPTVPGQPAKKAGTLTRRTFEGLSPAEKKAHFKAGGVVTD